MVFLITTAFGLVAALAWNDAIKTIFKEVFGAQSTVGPMLLYAVIVTIIAVILTIIVARAVAKSKTICGAKIFTCKLSDYELEVESQFLEYMFKEYVANKEKFLIKSLLLYDRLLVI